MDSIEIKITCENKFVDFITAEMVDLGFASFMETEAGFNAYIDANLFDDHALQKLKAHLHDIAPFQYEVEIIPEVNWNESWEKNYEPIIVEDQILIKAPFHKIEKKYPYELLITPKMSFGTGHHETTYLMLQHQLNIDFNGKSVLDAGCGTGVLGIFAGIRGASTIVGCDVDSWAIENSEENFRQNHVEPTSLKKGSVSEIPERQQYDIILANISRNIILRELPLYRKLLKDGGYLVISGFPEHDLEIVQNTARQNHLELVQYLTRNHWIAIILQ